MPVILQLSSRNKFKSETNFIENNITNYLYRIKPDPTSTLPPVYLKEKKDFDISGLFPKKIESILVLVHGYRAVFESIEKKYEKIESSLKDKYDLIIEYYWPASWEPVIGFAAASSRVEYASEIFYSALNELFESLDLSELKNIVLSGHSLGCYLLLAARPIIKVSKSFCEKMHFVFAAPAINYDEASDEMGTMIRNLVECRELSIAFSEKDWVLKYAFRMSPANFFSPAFVFKRMEWYVLLPDSLRKKISFFNLTPFIGSSHGKYVDTDPYYNLVLRTTRIFPK